MAQFAHLLPAERLLWARWLVQHGAEYDRYDYDVRVGQGRPVSPTEPDYIQEMARELSKKRIDAVGWRAGQPTIFEITPRAGRTTYGALLAYRELWRETFPTLPIPGLAAVVGAIDPDMLRLLQQAGARVDLIPEPAA